MTANDERQATISATEAALLLGLSTRWLRQLGAEGWIERTDRGRYSLVAVVHGYIRFLRDRMADQEAKGAAGSRLATRRWRKSNSASRSAMPR